MGEQAVGNQEPITLAKPVLYDLRRKQLLQEAR